MHAYYRHIGDYAKRAGHLSTLEHGILTLLEDYYLDKETPIPDWMAPRIARCAAADVQPVLREFFHQDADGNWCHAGCDKVIEEYRSRADTSRANGAKGGRPPKQKPQQQPQAPENPAGTQQKPARGKRVTKKVTPPGAEVYPVGFLGFWEAYPDGKRSKKLDAFKVWDRDGMEEFASSIIKDVEKRKAMHWDWIKEDGKYIPGAQVYLNGRRWNDDMVPIPARGAANGNRSAREGSNLDVARNWARDGAAPKSAGNGAAGGELVPRKVPTR